KDRVARVRISLQRNVRNISLGRATEAERRDGPALPARARPYGAKASAARVAETVVPAGLADVRTVVVEVCSSNGDYVRLSSRIVGAQSATIIISTGVAGCGVNRLSLRGHLLEDRVLAGREGSARLIFGRAPGGAHFLGLVI